MMDAPQRPKSSRPLIAHIVHRFGIGGLENGLVNLINSLPADAYRHAIVSLTDYSDFRSRLRRDDVEVIALHKPEGKYPSLYRPLWSILRRLNPMIVHTRNLATLEAQIPAFLVGVPCRVHGEHGRDVFDLDGANRAYNLMRKGIRPLVHEYIAVSRDLGDWLTRSIHVPAGRMTQIYNGVDTLRFHPSGSDRPAVMPEGFLPDGAIVIGTVGRLAAVKDQLTLIRAFIQLLEREPGARDYLRLMVVGDGSLRGDAHALLNESGTAPYAWLAGDQDDVSRFLQAMDVFALPSLGEGISNTILEAMSSALPVVATRVGGSPELVEEGKTGRLVPPSDPAAMAQALWAYVVDPALRAAHGRAGRMRVERRFSLDAMVAGYRGVYDRVLGGRAVTAPSRSDAQ